MDWNAFNEYDYVKDGGIYTRGVQAQISSVIIIKLSSTQYRVQRTAYSVQRTAFPPSTTWNENNI